ncbi:iron complex outermembrane recepter protein [Soonwooa buanensis]|uniref:Iron complex outermembrane recepter protein n=1 Tax=Soonwooa buanensis TaxID=619805 RepID=A0A1T5G2M0_9FLAO|nr:TonB-dependent receptor [Soonwooa buanensis]SKC02735.1 iron complex outermembrane recepter protein [Soonwooa buanensis]
MKHLIIILILFAAIQTNAQKQDSIQNIDSIVIISQAKKLDAVNYLNYLPQKDVQNNGTELPFLINKLPAVTAYSDTGSNNGYSYYRIRGIDQTRVNVNFEGAPMNEPEDQGAYFSNFPDFFNSVDFLQIQKGIGLSKNGTASYGGSLQISAPNLHQRALEFGTNYGSYNAFRAYAKYTSGLIKNKAIHVRVSEIYNGGYKYNSTNHGQSAMISAGIFNPKSTWKFNTVIGNQNNDLAWLGVTKEQIDKDPRTNANRNEKDHFFQSFFQLLNQIKLGQNTTWQNAVHYTFLKGNYDFNLNNFIGLPEDAEIYNYGFQSNFGGFYSNLETKWNHLKIQTGLNANWYNRDLIFTEKQLGELYENTGYKNDFSAFVKADYHWEKIKISGSLQYRHAKFFYKGDAELTPLEWDFLNPKFGITYSLKPNQELYFSLGKVGREPTRNDIFAGNDNLSLDENNELILGTTTPEYVTDYEFGYRYFSNNLKISANLFYMKFKDEIVLNGQFGPNGIALTNKVDKSYRMGLELSADYKLNDNWMLSNNSSWMSSKIKQSTESFTPILTPKLIVNQEIKYVKNALQLQASYRYQATSFINFANDKKIPSYQLVNAAAFYNFTKWEVGILVNNIFNNIYFNHAYVEADGTAKYFVQMLINFMISVKYKAF